MACVLDRCAISATVRGESLVKTGRPSFSPSSMEAPRHAPASRDVPEASFLDPPSHRPTGEPVYHDVVYSDLSSFVSKVELHKGRHSTVWSARCTRTGRVVVIKAYDKAMLKPRQLLNVQRELNLLCFFRSSGCHGVVKLLASFEDSGFIYLVFDACMRGDLYQLLVKHKGRLSEAFVASHVVVPLLSTLKHLHQLNIVHRDIKPENIFLMEDGEIQVGDFGLAAHKLQDRLTERVGTLDYMAPEVLSMPTPDEAAARGQQPHIQPYDEKVDIWAVGVLVYEFLAGSPPFEVEDPKETARLILKAEVSTFPPGLSDDCLDFIKLSLRKDPSKRPGAHQLLQHPWLQPHLSSSTPPPRQSLHSLKQIIHASWSMGGLRPSAGNLLLECFNAVTESVDKGLIPVAEEGASTRRKALSTGDDPFMLDLSQPPKQPAPSSKSILTRAYSHNQSTYNAQHKTSTSTQQPKHHYHPYGRHSLSGTTALPGQLAPAAATLQVDSKHSLVSPGLGHQDLECHLNNHEYSLDKSFPAHPVTEPRPSSTSSVPLLLAHISMYTRRRASCDFNRTPRTSFGSPSHTPTLGASPTNSRPSSSSTSPSTSPIPEAPAPSKPAAFIPAVPSSRSMTRSVSAVDYSTRSVEDRDSSCQSKNEQEDDDQSVSGAGAGGQAWLARSFTTKKTVGKSRFCH